MKARVLAWLHQAVSEGDGSPSIKRILFSVAVVAALGLCVADFCRQRALTPNAVQLATIVVTSTAGAYVGGRFAENRDT